MSDAAPQHTAPQYTKPQYTGRLTRVPWGSVALFVLIAFGLAWLVALPAWMMDASDPGYQVTYLVVASVMMYTPAIATLAVLFITRVPRTQRLRFLGVWPLRPAKRVVWFIVGSLIVPVLITVIALAVAVAAHWVSLDLVEFSGFQEMLDEQFAGFDEQTAALASASLPPIGVLVALQVLSMPLNGVVNALLAFGEEIGWRGWLLPALRPLGTWPALVLTGIIWGLWHSPLILLGHNFGLTDWRGVALMTVGCIVWGVLLGWSRLRSGSVWPAVFGHGALNASAGLVFMLAAADVPVDPALALPLGVSGWIAIAAVVVVLTVLGQFRAERQPDLAPPKPKPGVPASTSSEQRS